MIILIFPQIKPCRNFEKAKDCGRTLISRSGKKVLQSLNEMHLKKEIWGIILTLRLPEPSRLGYVAYSYKASDGLRVKSKRHVLRHCLTVQEERIARTLVSLSTLAKLSARRSTVDSDQTLQAHQNTTATNV